MCPFSSQVFFFPPTAFLVLCNFLVYFYLPILVYKLSKSCSATFWFWSTDHFGLTTIDLLILTACDQPSFVTDILKIITQGLVVRLGLILRHFVVLTLDIHKYSPSATENQKMSPLQHKLGQCFSCQYNFL